MHLFLWHLAAEVRIVGRVVDDSHLTKEWRPQSAFLDNTLPGDRIYLL